MRRVLLIISLFTGYAVAGCRPVVNALGTVEKVICSSSSSGAGTGDVVGPGSSTDNAIPAYDGTTGKLLQNTTCTIDTGVLTCTSIKAGDGTDESGLILPELATNGTNDFRIYGAPSQSADGCIVFSGQPSDDQVGVYSSTTSTIDGKTCRLIEFKTIPACADSGGNHLNYDQSTNTFSCGTSSSGGGGGVSITANNGQFWVWGWPGAGSNFTPVANTVYYMRFIVPMEFSLRYIQSISNRTAGNYLAGAIYDSSGNKVASTDWRANGQSTTAYDVGDLGASGVTLSGGVYFLGYVVEAGSLYGYPYMFGGQANQISGAPQNFSGSNAATGSGATLTMPSSIGTKTNVGLDTTSMAGLFVSK